MKRLTSLSLVIVTLTAATLLSACSSTTSAPPAQDSSATNQNAPAANAKKGDTTKTGMISKAGDTYFLQEAGQQPAPIDSYAVDLAGYVGQTVTVTGQYSGDTLFVGKVE